MTLYEYGITPKGELVRTAHEGFEEKPKSYMRKDGYPRMILKDLIGVYSTDRTSWHHEMWLLEPDDDRAKHTIRSHYFGRLSAEEQRHAMECERLNTILESLK